MEHAPYWADSEFALHQVCMAIRKAKALPYPKPVKVFLCTDSAQVLDQVSGLFPDVFAVPKRFRPIGQGRCIVRKWELKVELPLSLTCIFLRDALP